MPPRGGPGRNRGGTHLAPDQHGAEDHLQPIEEVVPDDDDGGAPRRPPLTGADGFDAGRGCFGDTQAERDVYTKISHLIWLAKELGFLMVAGHRTNA